MDTSNYALAVILSIIDTNGEVHPVAFLSRTFSTTELNYDIHDKELLAIFEAFKAWWHYLKGVGTPINIITDYKNLVYFSSIKLLICWQAQWSEFLSAFNIVIYFCPD
jgi:hypothetical protein